MLKVTPCHVNCEESGRVGAWTPEDLRHVPKGINSVFVLENGLRKGREVKGKGTLGIERAAIGRRGVEVYHIRGVEEECFENGKGRLILARSGRMVKL